mgnify:FL=1
MKKYEFQNLFCIYSLGPIKYITQNKNDLIQNTCVKDVFLHIEQYFTKLDNGIYIALTHRTMIDQIKKNNGKIVCKIQIGCHKTSINKLKEYFFEKTACPKCEKRERCKFYNLFSKKTESRNQYFVIFMKLKNR